MKYHNFLCTMWFTVWWFILLFIPNNWKAYGPPSYSYFQQISWKQILVWR